MQRARSPILAVLALSIAACGGGTEPVRSGPAVEREIVDGVEIVRNVSGSRHGELELRPIIDIGGDEDDYIFTAPMAMWPTSEMILVADWQMGVRAYRLDGTYLRSYGSIGEGPGEYVAALSTAVIDGRVVAQGFRHLHFYSVDGEHEESWPLQFSDSMALAGTPMMVSADGRVFLYVTRFLGAMGDLDDSESGYMEFGADGWAAEFFRGSIADDSWRESTVRISCPDQPDGTCNLSIPYFPGPRVDLTPELALVTGDTGRYRLEIARHDGSRMVIERFEDPAPVSDLERDYYVAQRTRRGQRTVPGFEFDADLVPATKPHYMLVLGARGGRLLVVRESGSRWRSEDSDCGLAADWTPDNEHGDCIEAQVDVDVFDTDGAYLGWFRRPEDVRIGFAHATGNELWVQATAPDGNPVIRGYEILIPTDDSAGR